MKLSWDQLYCSRMDCCDGWVSKITTQSLEDSNYSLILEF